MGGISHAPLFSRMMGWKESRFHVECVKMASLAFLDSQLNRDDAATKYLNDEANPLFSLVATT